MRSASYQRLYTIALPVPALSWSIAWNCASVLVGLPPASFPILTVSSTAADSSTKSWMPSASVALLANNLSSAAENAGASLTSLTVTTTMPGLDAPTLVTDKV